MYAYDAVTQALDDLSLASPASNAVGGISVTNDLLKYVLRRAVR